MEPLFTRALNITETFYHFRAVGSTNTFQMCGAHHCPPPHTPEDTIKILKTWKKLTAAVLKTAWEVCQCAAWTLWQSPNPTVRFADSIALRHTPLASGTHRNKQPNHSRSTALYARRHIKCRSMRPTAARKEACPSQICKQTSTYKTFAAWGSRVRVPLSRHLILYGVSPRQRRGIGVVLRAFCLC